MERTRQDAGRLLRLVEGEVVRVSLSACLAPVVALPFFVRPAAQAGSHLDSGGWLVVVRELGTTAIVPFMLVAWAVQVLVYVTLSWLVHRRMGTVELLDHTRGLRRSQRWWWSLLGAGSAESWTLNGGLLATMLVVLGARIGFFDGSLGPILIGMAAVGASWVVMVYSFALRYAGLYADGALDVPFTGSPVMDDFLTVSVQCSTLFERAAQPRGSAAAKALRTHSVFAWLFNTVILALTVAVLFGGLTG